MTRETRGARRAGVEGRSNGSGDDVRRRILQAIEQYRGKHDRWPTYREIGAAVRIESTSHVSHHVAMLVKQGYLTRERGISRGVALAGPRTTDERAHRAGVQILGRIAAGAPLDLFDTGEPEVLDVDVHAAQMRAGPLNPETDVYALQVSGQSMIEDGILDGDYVLVRPDMSVMKGAIVVAVERTGNGGHGAATVKRIVIADDHIRLDPANPAYPARRIGMQEWDRDWMVQGTVVGIYRRYDARPATG